MTFKELSSDMIKSNNLIGYGRRESWHEGVKLRIEAMFFEEEGDPFMSKTLTLNFMIGDDVVFYGWTPSYDDLIAQDWEIVS